jgi:6-phosphogluconolactonase (cycloisomerase 2 family)
MAYTKRLGVGVSWAVVSWMGCTPAPPPCPPDGLPHDATVDAEPDGTSVDVLRRDASVDVRGDVRVDGTGADAVSADGSVGEDSGIDGDSPAEGGADAGGADGDSPGDGSVFDGASLDGSDPDGSVLDGSSPDGSDPDGSVEGGGPRLVRSLNAYVVSSTSNTLTAFSVSPEGFLTRIQTLATGRVPYSVAVDREARFAYVANVTDNRVTHYAIDPANGSLRAVGNTSVVGAAHVALHPTSRLAFVSAFAPGDNITAFNVNRFTGALTPTGSVLSGLNAPFASAVDVTGQFLVYSTARGPFRLGAARIDARTGTLSGTASEPTGASPRGVAIDPTGRFAYVANIGANQISAYAIDRGTGSLTLRSTLSLPSPRGIAFSSDGLTLYSTSYPADLTGSVAVIRVDPSTGALSSPTFTPTGGRQPFELTLDPTGRFVFVVHASTNDMRAFLVDEESGALTPVGGLAPCGVGPVAVAIAERVSFAM